MFVRKRKDIFKMKKIVLLLAIIALCSNTANASHCGVGYVGTFLLDKVNQNTVKSSQIDLLSGSNFEKSEKVRLFIKKCSVVLSSYIPSEIMIEWINNGDVVLTGYMSLPRAYHEGINQYELDRVMRANGTLTNVFSEYYLDSRRKYGALKLSFSGKELKSTTSINLILIKIGWWNNSYPYDMEFSLD